ncbi:MAG: DUF4339 domain-containing protein, partial [Planctomycetaceae bacterium]|nr:DUF4339 domain-containing protein [Planctomycetaceae bacterium]
SSSHSSPITYYRLLKVSMLYLQARNGLAGPFTDDELLGMVIKGKVTPKSLIRKVDAKSWNRAEWVQGLFTP